LRPAVGERRDHDHKRLNEYSEALVIEVVPLSPPRLRGLPQSSVGSV